MKKRAVGMVMISALLCGIIAVYTPKIPAPEQTPTIVLAPDTDNITFEISQPIGTQHISGLKDMLMPSEDYDEIFPYAARIIGWKEDGTPVYRYALADSAGELLTNPVYTAAERMECGETVLWLLHDEAQRVTCAVEDGSWILGPFEGSVTIQNGYIFIKRWDSPATIVYNSTGKILGQVNGTVTSCSSGIIVSQQDTAWYISDSETMKPVATLAAVHIGAFSGSSATVQLSETEWGFIDKQGNIVQTDAAWIDEACNGYALAKNSVGNFGILHVSGETAVQFEYSKGAYCGQDYPLYQLWEDDITCIVFSAATKQRLRLPKDLHAQQLTALPDNYFAYLDENGCTVVFDDLKSVTLAGEAVFYQQNHALIASMENGYQIFDMNEGDAGKPIRSYRYTVPSQQASHSDMTFTITDPDTGLQGAGNIKGRLVLEAKYDSVTSIGNSHFAVIQGCWSGIVDSHGDWIVRIRLAGLDKGGDNNEVQ